jgi:RNA polymerase sigma-70 factor (ECF subfamily)
MAAAVSGTSNDELLALHQALLEGDAAAPMLLAEKLVPMLRTKLRPLKAKLTDPQVVESAIGQSVATYLRRPEVFDPNRGSLPSYLAMDAAGDVKNELEKRRWEIAHDEVVERTLVELGLRDRNSPVEEEALDDLDPFDVPEANVEVARRLLAKLSPRDRELTQLLVDEVRSYAAWAGVLGIAHLPLEVQKREVKRHKDRIRRKLARIGERSG